MNGWAGVRKRYACAQEGIQSAYPASNGVRKRPAFAYKMACKARTLRATASAVAMPARTRGRTKRMLCARRRPQSPCLCVQKGIQSRYAAHDGVRNRHACAQKSAYKARTRRATASASAMPARKRAYKAHARQVTASTSAMPARKRAYKAHARRATASAIAMPLHTREHTTRVLGK